MYQSTIERPAASMVYAAEAKTSSFLQHAGNSLSHIHTDTHTHAWAQTHKTLALFWRGFPDLNTGSLYSFRLLHPLSRRLLVSLTPAQSLPSPRWQTSASPSVARSSCRGVSPVCWSWESKIQNILYFSLTWDLFKTTSSGLLVESMLTLASSEAMTSPLSEQNAGWSPTPWPLCQCQFHFSMTLLPWTSRYCSPPFAQLWHELPHFACLLLLDQIESRHMISSWLHSWVSWICVAR